MKTVFLCALLVVTALGAAPESKKKWAFDLVDGSKFFGTPVEQTIPIQTSYGKVNVAIGSVEDMLVNNTHTRISLANGDTLTGTIALTKMNVLTILGPTPISVPLAVLKRMHSTQNCQGKRPAGLVSLWTGDNTTLDSYGDNNGILHNGATYAKGKVGSAFYFDKEKGSYFSAEYDDSFPLGDVDRTIHLWAFLVELASSHNSAVFFSYGAVGHTSEAFVLLQFGSDYCPRSGVCIGFSQWGNSITGPILMPNRWYHVAVTLASGESTLYLSGDPVGWGRITVDTTRGNGQFYLGDIPIPSDNTNHQLHGLIDEVAVYNRALSPEEIRHVFETENAGSALCPASKSSSPVIAHTSEAAKGSRVRSVLDV